MTTSLFEGYVAIDTNVFEHLLNPQKNNESHISELLMELQKQNVSLIVDDGSRVSNEYEHRIAATLKNQNNTNNEMYILRYWIRYVERHKVSLDMGDSLMKTIRGVIFEHSESVDRIFVYIAFKKGKILISNDERHIVSSEGNRKKKLLRETRKLRPAGADILTSQEAHDRILVR